MRFTARARHIDFDPIRHPCNVPTTPTNNWLAATYFFLPEAPPGEGEGYEVSLNVDDVKKSPLTYAHGYWKLDSSVAVERPAGMWRGLLARGLNPIPLEDVHGPT
jgi:hypothetical protein